MAIDQDTSQFTDRHTTATRYRPLCRASVRKATTTSGVLGEHADDDAATADTSKPTTSGPARDRH